MALFSKRKGRVQLARPSLFERATSGRRAKAPCDYCETRAEAKRQRRRERNLRTERIT